MKEKLFKIFKNLGFNQKETDVYLACLEIGKASVIQLAKKAKIKRTTTYNIINSLIERGLLSKHEDRKGQKFSAEPPEKVLSLLQQSEKDLKKLIPELSALTSAESEFKPEVKFYEGKEGLKAVYWDSLTSCQRGDEIAGYFTEDPVNVFPEYIQERVSRGIRGKAIAANSEAIRKHTKNDKKELRQTKLVNSHELPVSIEMNIYKDKVSFMNYRGSYFGVIIKSPQIAKSEKAIFELLWKKIA